MLYVNIVCCFRAHNVSQRFDRLLSGEDTNGHCSRKRVQQSKKRKKSRFLNFENKP